ncbi:hypothetical protein BMI86_10210 [Thioclava sp. DLFJ5-1]|nr:hypothetical protein BMI86_10210 [Thioclava sp. DLFJ5-1]
MSDSYRIFHANLDDEVHTAIARVKADPADIRAFDECIQLLMRRSNIERNAAVRLLNSMINS